MFSRFNNIHAAQLVASIGSSAVKDEQVRGRYQKSGEKERNETRRNKRHKVEQSYISCANEKQRSITFGYQLSN